jgi:hypothetical protein
MPDPLQYDMSRDGFYGAWFCRGSGPSKEGARAAQLIAYRCPRRSARRIVGRAGGLTLAISVQRVLVDFDSPEIFAVKSGKTYAAS